MSKYRKKPQEIEAVKARRVVSNPEGYLVQVRQNPDTMYLEVYNVLHDSWIKFDSEDMIRIDQAPRDVYPIDRETFEQTYEYIGE